MCLSRAGRVRRVDGELAQVETAGQTRWCSILACPEVAAGDPVLVQADLIVEVLSEVEASRIDAAFRELDALAGRRP